MDCAFAAASARQTDDRNLRLCTQDGLIGSEIDSSRSLWIGAPIKGAASVFCGVVSELVVKSDLPITQVMHRTEVK
jgi:hypothetical protein